MKVKYSLGAFVLASLVVGCRPAGTQSVEEGVAYHPEGPVTSTFWDIEAYLDDPQLKSLARETNPIQTWFVPKVFGGENGEMHVCVYVNNEPRPANRYDDADTSNYDIERFERSRVLKGGKYINWSTLFQVLNDQERNGAWVPKIKATFPLTSNMLKAEKEKLKDSLASNLENMTVIQPTRISGILFDYYANETEKDKPESILAGLLLTLDRTPATGNDCPSAENLANKARGEGRDVVVVDPAPPVQLKVPTCSGDQRLVHHNVKNGWLCEGRGAWEQYQKHCDQQPGFGFYRIDPNGSVTDRDNWKCVKP
jgi:hypothetical protein